ncbi:MAG: serine kinase [Bacteroidetes bacterium]|nr:serine kinase [Bacteroidota bacterium]
MTVSDIAVSLGLKIYGGENGLSREISGGYTSDLLSDVMGHAGAGKVWITLQTHKNIMAIASLKELAAIILVKEYLPEKDMLDQSNIEDIPVLGTSDEAFEISGKLFNLLNRR